MTSTYFYQTDLISTLLAIVVFALFSVPPGYVLSRISGLLDFRRQPLAWRLIISIPVSLSACPILAYWLDRMAGPPAVWFAFALCWAVFAIFIVRDARNGEIRFTSP